MPTPYEGGRRGVLEYDQGVGIHSNALALELMLENAIDPPPYVYDEELPTYQQANQDRVADAAAVAGQISLQDLCRIDEVNRQQEVQLLSAVLFSILVTLFIMDALPLLGEPTSSTRTIRVYVWFALALVLSIVVATLSLLCKFWISGDEFTLLFLGAPRTPQSRFKAFKQCCMTGLMALGPALMYTAITCFGVGLLDLFWQLYPALSVGIVTTCGICSSGPILSYLSEGSLSEVPLPARIRGLWRVVLTACISGIARTGYTQQAGTQAETEFS